MNTAIEGSAFQHVSLANQVSLQAKNFSVNINVYQMSMFCVAILGYFLTALSLNVKSYVPSQEFRASEVFSWAGWTRHRCPIWCPWVPRGAKSSGCGGWGHHQTHMQGQRYNSFMLLIKFKVYSYHIRFLSCFTLPYLNGLVRS